MALQSRSLYGTAASEPNLIESKQTKINTNTNLANDNLTLGKNNNKIYYVKITLFERSF